METLEKEVIFVDGTIEKIRVPISKVEKEISRLVKRDKEMLDILAKL